MGRFQQIAKGTRARHTVELPLANGDATRVAVRPLLDAEDDEIDVAARAYAKARDVEDPKPGNTIYERGHALHTLLLACSDPDSPDSDPAPFFANVEEIRTGLDRDRIQYLLTAQQVWQDQCAPQQLQLSGDDFIAKVVEVATSEDDRPFYRMRQGLQWIFMRALAVQCLNSPELKSLSGLASVPITSGAARAIS